MGEWQTIETAPRDGSRLLFWDAKGFAVSGCWYVQSAMDTPNGYDPGWAWWSADEDLVMWDGGPDDGPTHWQPLTAPAGSS